MEQQIKCDNFEPMKRILLIAVFTILVLAGCLKRETYPNEPVIALKSFVVYPDSANLTITFKDGDGNFGLEDGQFEGDVFDCQKYYNVYCKYYEMDQGVWYLVDLDPCINPNATPFYYRVPLVLPSGQFKAQNGEVIIKMKPHYTNDFPRDTCRFEIRVVDFDQNSSNTIVTPSFVKPG